LYVWHSFLIYFIVRRLTGFRWSAANRKIGLLFFPVAALVFGSISLLPFWLATAIGTLATLVSGIYSIRVLLQLVPLERIPMGIRRLLARFGLAPQGTGQ
jgi:PST family polysaccharide transporter